MLFFVVAATSSAPPPPNNNGGFSLKIEMFFEAEQYPDFRDDSRVTAIVTANIVLICVATVTIAARIYVRAFILKSIGWDDGGLPLGQTWH